MVTRTPSMCLQPQSFHLLWSVERRRGVVWDCVSKHLYLSTIFFVDKVATATAINPLPQILNAPQSAPHPPYLLHCKLHSLPLAHGELCIPQ
ncbi:hypothetical protein Cni_G15093 [Canna indica]|uniref:Uncharacterized protein n=1 Tax=Canna indica TaxID=4628 RepID=A0AAQ3QEF9_9LILI|nr:hypothetical protein Cni_G15093 [Canna indica]